MTYPVSPVTSVVTIRLTIEVVHSFVDAKARARMALARCSAGYSARMWGRGVQVVMMFDGVAAPPAKTKDMVGQWHGQLM